MDEQELRFNPSRKNNHVYFQDGDTISKVTLSPNSIKQMFLMKFARQRLAWATVNFPYKNWLMVIQSFLFWKQRTVFLRQNKNHYCRKERCIGNCRRENTVEELESELALAEKVEEKEWPRNCSARPRKYDYLWKWGYGIFNQYTFCFSESAFLEVKILLSMRMEFLRK